jgi:CDP-diacylglycerol--glycerol-3-phosphate 3-phosphatidyltransferase/cardiolipin synthase
VPFNLPIVLTWLRVIAIPLLVALYYFPDHWMTLPERNLLACVLFSGAAITDWLDGWLARRWNQESSFGAFLDPVADKLIVAAALIVLVELDRVNAIIAFIIIGREITISALREWMAKVGEARSVAVNMLGKFKTVAQLVAIPMLLYHQPIGVFQPQRVGTFLIWAAALLTVVSMVYYLKLAAPRAFRHR